MNRFATRLTAASVLTVTLATAALAPIVANAETIRSTCTSEGCHRDCEQHQPDGTTIYYEHGTEILVVTADGKEHKFRCNNGNWQAVARIMPVPVSAITASQQVAR